MESNDRLSAYRPPKSENLADFIAPAVKRFVERFGQPPSYAWVNDQRWGTADLERVELTIHLSKTIFSGECWLGPVPKSEPVQDDDDDDDDDDAEERENLAEAGDEVETFADEEAADFEKESGWELELS